MRDYDTVLQKIESALKTHLALDVIWAGEDNPVSRAYYERIRLALKLLEMERPVSSQAALEELRQSVNQAAAELSITFDVDDFAGLELEDVETIVTDLLYASDRPDNGPYLAVMALSVCLWAAEQDNEALRALPGLLSQIAEALAEIGRAHV